MKRSKKISDVQAILNFDEYDNPEVEGYSETLSQAELKNEELPTDPKILQKFKNEIIEKAKKDNQTQ